MALIGNETLYVLGTRANGQPAATTFETTTGAIAALASSQGVGETVYTSITTVGDGVLTAAAIIGGGISRSGPTAAYTDTTDTAVAIVAAITAAFVGQSFYVNIKNLTAFAETLAAGSGVTLTGSVIIPPNSVAMYLVTLTSLTAVTIFHVETNLLSNGTPTAITALSTVGAGTITGAGIAAGITSRTGAQSATAFTDTTDTATAIIAAQFNARIGMKWEFVYQNTTNAPATLTGGVGVTVSGVTLVPANSTARFLVTYTAAATLTIVGFSVTMMPTSGTFTATGSSAVTVANAAVSPASQILVTLKTVGGTVGAFPTVKTITAGTGFTITATAADTSVYNYMIIG